MSSTVWHVLSLRAVNVPMCVCWGVMLDDTLINTLSGPRALWIPLRKTLHDHLPPLGSAMKDVNTHIAAYTQAHAPAPKHMYPQIGFRTNHVSAHASHICFTSTHTHTRFMKPTVCVTSGCLVTSQSTRRDSIRSWSASTAQQRH